MLTHGPNYAWNTEKERVKRQRKEEKGGEIEIVREIGTALTHRQTEKRERNKDKTITITQQEDKSY